MTARKPTGFLSALVRDSRWRAGGAQAPPGAANSGEPAPGLEPVAVDPVAAARPGEARRTPSTETVATFEEGGEAPMPSRVAAPDVSLSASPEPATPVTSVESAARGRRTATPAAYVPAAHAHPQTLARTPLQSETGPTPPVQPVQADAVEIAPTAPTASAPVVRRKLMTGPTAPTAAVLLPTTVIGSRTESTSRVGPPDATAGTRESGIVSVATAAGPPSPVSREIRDLVTPLPPGPSDSPASLSEPVPGPQRQPQPVAKSPAAARLGSPAHRRFVEAGETVPAAALPEDSLPPDSQPFGAVVAEGLTNLLGRRVVGPAPDEPSRLAATTRATTTAITAATTEEPLRAVAAVRLDDPLIAPSRPAASPVGSAVDLVPETSPVVHGAALPIPTPVAPAAAAQPPVPTAARLLPSASELALSGAASRPLPPPEATAPRVHIGTVEIVVAAPVEKRPAAAANPKPSSNLASRRYLRSL
jgi:hypothetical protein